MEDPLFLPFIDIAASVPAHVWPLLKPDGPLPPRTPAWRPPELVYLAECIPKADSAERAFREYPVLLSSSSATGSHAAQEKLNGVYVLWDGQDLYTKSGRRIDAPHFTQWLPPGVAIVGELYLGNGHHPFHCTVTLASNGLPALINLPPGTQESQRRLVWRQARLVAFDMPGLEPAVGWTYARRYALLRTVVAAWSRRQSGARGAWSVLPLQLIRQYPLDTVPDFFREVVEGRTHPNQRRFPPFGIPEAVLTTATVHGQRWHVAGPTWLAADVSAFRPDDPTVPGEGLMIYDQSAPWVPRGSTGRRFSGSVFKFKPTIVAFGAALEGPDDRPLWQRQRPKGVDTGNDIGDTHSGDEHDQGGESRCASTVRVRWLDPWLGGMRTVRVFRGGAGGVDWQEGSRVYFSFVFYDERPKFTRFLGPALPEEYRVRLQSRAGAVPVDPTAWPNGTVVGVFPFHFPWDHWAFGAGLQYEDHALRPTPSPFVLPDPGFQGGLGTVARSVRVIVRTEDERRERLTAATRASLRSSHANWLIPSGSSFLARFLVCACFVTRIWADRTGATAAAGADMWSQRWRGDGDTGRRPYTRWGPFRLSAAVGERTVDRWARGMLRVLLSVLASVWMRIGIQYGPTPLRGLDRAQGREYLVHLEHTVRTMISGELRPRWAAVREYISPPIARDGPFDPMHQMNLNAFAEYAAVCLGSEGSPPAPPWEAMWGEGDGSGNATMVDLDAAACCQFFLERSDRIRAAMRTLTETQLRGWRPDPDSVLLQLETALPVVASELPDRIAAARAAQAAVATSENAEEHPWLQQRSASLKRLRYM